MRGMVKTGALSSSSNNSPNNPAPIDNREARSVTHDRLQNIDDQQRTVSSRSAAGLAPPQPPSSRDMDPIPAPELSTKAQKEPTLLLNGNCSRKSRKGWSVKWDRYFWFMIQFKDHIELRAYGSEKEAKEQANAPLSNYSVSIDTLAEFQVLPNSRDTKAKSNRFAFDLKGISDVTQAPGAADNAPPPKPKSIDLSLCVSTAKSRGVWFQAFTYVQKYLNDRKLEADWVKAEGARRRRVKAYEINQRSQQEYQRQQQQQEERSMIVNAEVSGYTSDDDVAAPSPVTSAARPPPPPPMMTMQSQQQRQQQRSPMMMMQSQQQHEPVQGARCE
jgi:hypothetical protein